MTAGGIRHLVERAYRESGEQQYLRELVVNALEANATRIEIGPEWGAVERHGVYRLMIADNGKGMSPDELLQFLNTFGGGGKPIGDAHENYGVGAKTSLVPWNHDGVVVLSWTTENPEGAMIWLMRDPATGEYGAKKFETEDGTFTEKITPHGEWAKLRPDWIEHGTVIVCLGNTGAEDTFLGKDGNGDVKGISAYLNKRFWEIPPGVELYVRELRSTKRNHWPRSYAEATAPSSAGKIDRRWNRRKIRGAKYFAVDLDAGEGTGALATGTVALRDGTEIDWYLWPTERPKVHSYAHRNGYIAALYRNELYDTQQHFAHFRSFGITQAEVRGRLTLIARPPLADGGYGVYPDTARNALKIQGTKRAGEALPWADWAQEFAESMPAEIIEAEAKAGPSRSGTLQDQTWRSRLVDRFGARWKSLRFLVSPRGKAIITPTATPSHGSRSTTGSRTESGDGSSTGQDLVDTEEKPRAAHHAHNEGTKAASPSCRRGGLPEYQWTTADAISEKSDVAAVWCPPSATHPQGLVQLARDFSAIREVKTYWRDKYPDHFSDRIDEVVEEVYGEAMVARLAHSEGLACDPRWGRTRVDNELRTGAALTMAVLGLLSEDTVISNRLRGLGVRRKAS